MPISDQVLAQPNNNFIAVSGTATVGQAVAALLGQDGQAWWHLIVEWPARHWGCTTFADLYGSVRDAPNALSTLLADWRGLASAPAIDRDAVNDQQAIELARRSASGLIVVMQGAVPAGIIYAATTRGGAIQPVSVGKLRELVGTPVSLKDYGAILLAASKKPKP